MSPEEARNRFSEALEGELDEERRRHFEAALAADSTLAAEYEDFRAMMEGFAELHDSENHDSESKNAPPDLLRGVQKKLRDRSRGRFFRDRFAEKGGQWTPALLGVVMLVVLAVAWFGLSYVQLR